ncbi:MAG TPA: molybdopterin-dependent oxidoreductase [Haliangiales bacterium]|nr:molybdopterin-dependent oxidoreductase [Haliangiales bacterium]
MLAKTTCNRDCPDACSIVATIEDGRVVKIAGDPDHPITQGFLCWRTNHYLETQYSPDRVLTPLHRRSLEEDFRPIGWDDALDLAAERLVAIRRESGPAAIFHYRSGGSLGLLKHLSDYFFERFGPVTMKRGDICSGAGDWAQETDFGDEDSHDLHDLLRSRHILLWGKNVFVSSPHTIPVLRDARARGAELVLIDPVHQRSASLCSACHQPRPGGDLALALAVARVLFERGWVDPGAAAACDHVDEFRALAERRSVAEHCADADVAPAVAEDLARRLHDRPCAILVGWGMGRRVNGAAIVRALDALGALSGNLGIPGGGVSFYYKRRGAFDTSFIQGKSAAPRTVCEPLFGPDVLAMRDPPIRAVWITAGNPVAMLPESLTVAEALRTRELVVVVDSFLTDTARLAHLVLPTTTLLEADDILGAYGHHYLGVARPVVPPPPNVKSDLEIAQGLAARVGLADVMAGDARAWKRRMVEKKSGLRLEAIEARPTKNPLAKEVLFADRRFATASGRMNLMTDLPPDEPRAADGYPLWLMSLSTDRAQSSQWAKPVSGRAVVTVHPDAAAGIADGADARLESAIASIAVTVKHDARQRRDVALMAKGGHLSAGRCANALIRARTTDGGEGAALYDERVRLVAER